MKSLLMRTYVAATAITAVVFLSAAQVAHAQVWPPCGANLFSPSYQGGDDKSNHVVAGDHAPSCGGRGPYGLQYQCVEYIRRFYYQVKRVDTSAGTPWDGRNARDFFAAAPLLNLDSFSNGKTSVSPKPDDIIVFKGPKGDVYGHIAIARAVDAASVSIVEQNWNPTGQAKLLLSQASDGTYTLKRVGSSYTVLGWLRSKSSPCTTFTDNFNRADGPVGNGWADTVANVGGALVIRSNTLSTPGASGEAGIYRAFDLTKTVTVKATITQENGFGGLLRRYSTTFLFGNATDRTSGYGVALARSDQDYNNSSVSLVLNGVQVASLPATFQYGAAINVTVTFNPTDGSIVGSVVGDGNTFPFSFPARVVSPLPGGNVAIIQSFPDSRSSVITNPTIDDLSFSSCP